jgi:hypothetical protein
MNFPKETTTPMSKPFFTVSATSDHVFKGIPVSWHHLATLQSKQKETWPKYLCSIFDVFGWSFGDYYFQTLYEFWRRVEKLKGRKGYVVTTKEQNLP